MSRLNDYEVLRTVGSGAYGKCQKIRRKSDGKILAWKVVSYLKMSPRQRDRLTFEVELLKALNHPNIVQYHHHFADQEAEKLYIVMEYCEGGDLSSLIKYSIKKRFYIKEKVILRVLGQLASALKQCHRRPDQSVVLHQDLKPHNVFLDKSWNVKLGDFGLAQILPSKTGRVKTQVGTYVYMCPEKVSQTFYNEKSDIWSLGCLLYELCALKHPFSAGKGQTVADSILSGAFRRIPSQYSDELNSLIRDMLQVSAKLRPTVEDILHSSLLTGVVAEEEKSCDPLPQPTSVTDLRPRDEELQAPKKQKRRLEPEFSGRRKRRREGQTDEGKPKSPRLR